MRDEETGTWWQQVSGKAIHGPLKGHQLKQVFHDEISFAIWKREAPQGRVLKPVEHIAAANQYEPADWETWRDLRLRALRDSPSAFGSTYDREATYDKALWRDRLSAEQPTSTLSATRPAFSCDWTPAPSAASTGLTPAGGEGTRLTPSFTSHSPGRLRPGLHS